MGAGRGGVGPAVCLADFSGVGGPPSCKGTRFETANRFLKKGKAVTGFYLLLDLFLPVASGI